MEVGVEGVRDAKERVDPRRPPTALEAGDRRLGGAYELGEIGLGKAAPLPAIRNLPGDLREQPAFLGAREPCSDSFHGLTHISIMLYIAIVRYALSIASYVLVVAGFMIWAAVGPYGALPSAVALLALGAVHLIVGFTIGRSWTFALVLLLPLLALPVPTPEDAYEPLPMWFVMLYFGIPVALLLIGVGLVGRGLWEWRRAPDAV